jgi:hypothetical protein
MKKDKEDVKEAKIVKKIEKHLNKDIKESKQGIKDDKKLKKVAKKIS